MERSLQFGYAGNTDAGAWSDMALDALVGFMKTPAGQQVVLELAD